MVALPTYKPRSFPLHRAAFEIQIIDAHRPSTENQGYLDGLRRAQLNFMVNPSDRDCQFMTQLLEGRMCAGPELILQAHQCIRQDFLDSLLERLAVRSRDETSHGRLGPKPMGIEASPLVFAGELSQELGRQVFIKAEGAKPLKQFLARGYVLTYIYLSMHHYFSATMSQTEVSLERLPGNGMDHPLFVAGIGTVASEIDFAMELHDVHNGFISRTRSFRVFVPRSAPLLARGIRTYLGEQSVITYESDVAAKSVIKALPKNYSAVLVR